MTTNDIHRAATSMGEGSEPSPTSEPTARGPFSIPAASALPSAKRRSWEDYANDFRELSEQMATLQTRYDALQQERSSFSERYAALQQQRLRDQERLVLISRTRRALEANAVLQSNRIRNAQSELARRDDAVARLQADAHRMTAEIADLETTIKPLRDDSDTLARRDVELAEMNSRLKTLQADRDRLAERARPAAGWSRETAPDDIADADLNERLPPAIRMAGSSGPASIVDRVIAALALRRAREAARARDWQRAEAYYEVVLTVRRQSNLWTQFGHVLREQGRYAGAAAAYRAALSMDPGNAELHFVLGLAETRGGDEARGKESYRQALKLNPTLRDVHSELRTASLNE